MGIMLKIESLLPRDFSATIQKKLGYSGDSHEARKKVGFIFSYPLLVGVLTAIATALLYTTTDSLIIIIGYLVGILLAFASIYLLIDYQAMQRSRKVEESLPDALELVAVNISSGLTVENALVESARPEFGELAAFLKRAAKEIYSGTAIEKAFKEISEKIESEALQRSVLLLNEGMKKGASLGELLQRISAGLRSEASLKKEINANISMYLMLIIIATCMGAPLLFGAGTVVSMSFARQSNEIATSDYSSKMPLFNLLGRGQNDQEKFSVPDLELVSVASLFLTCLFASMIIGVIRYSRESPGLRYFPAMLIFSLVVYYVSTALLKKIILGM
jgi:Flp pilus assembly protein TadB